MPADLSMTGRRLVLLCLALEVATAFTPKKKASPPSTSPVTPMTGPNTRAPFGLQAFEPSAHSFRPSDFSVATERKGKMPRMLTGSPEIKVVPHHALEHKKWGTDNDHAEEYWFDDRIHTLGNAGLGGGLHAALAPLSTKCIDIFAYSGVDIRAQVARTLSETVGKSKAKVIDLCCGVGMSTRALRDAFPDAEKVVGIDTSPQMIAMAKFLDWHIHSFMPVLAVLSEKVSNAVTAAGNVFDHGNAEGTGQPDKHFDLVTIMYAFHEVPKQGRDRILAEAHRLLKPGGTLAVVDIACDYIPSMSMLSGEPYVIEYQKEIHNQIQRFRGFIRPRYEPVVPGHVGMWLLQRA